MLNIEPMSGYELKQEIAQSTFHFWTESDGQIYPTLNTLTELGCIDCLERPIGERSRKIYSITESGVKRLQDWLAKDIERVTVRHELLLKLFFGHNTTKQVLLNHIDKFQHDIEKKLQVFENILNSRHFNSEVQQRN